MSHAPHATFHFQSRGLELSAQKWLPPVPPRGVIVLVHGWGDHSGRYDEFAQFLRTAGYAVFSLDFEGHGQSPGVRAHIHQFQHLVDDLSAFVACVDAEIAGAPMFLCGYSMGGCVAASYLALHRHQITGVIFNASALAVSSHISSVKKILARILGGAFPRLPLSNLTAGRLMSRDPAEVARYDADALTYHGKITAGTGKQLLAANEWIGKHLDRIRLPFLVLQGTADALVDPEGATAVYEASPSGDKTLQLYQDALHDLLHESNKAEVFAHIKHWLDTRTAI